MKKRRNTSRRILFFLLCVIFIGKVQFIAKAEGMDFDVRVFPPENQRRQDAPGFDLLMAPGSEQVVEIELGNTSSEPITLIIAIATATTDNGGTVLFRPQEGHIHDNTLLYAMEDITGIESSTVVLEGDERIRIPVTIKMPDTAFDGVLAGGISIMQYVDIDEAMTAGTGMIINRFWMEIPILLRQTEEVVWPDLSLLEVHASQRNWRNIFAVRLQNPEAMFINDMEVFAYVNRAGEMEALFEQHMEQMQVAPNSNFTLAIPLSGERFVPGYYDFQMEVIAKNGNWSFRQRFYVSAGEAEAFNATDVSIQRTPLWIFIAAGGVLVFVIFLAYIVIFRRKSRKTTDIAVEELVRQMHKCT